MSFVFHPGLKPNDRNRARLYFSAFKNPAAEVPAVVDYYDGLSPIGMLGNDAYGDCVEAANGHIVEQQTYFGQGHEVVVSTQDALAEYSRITGFNPNDPSTDQGTMIQDGLDDMRKIGLNGHKIAAFAQLDVTKMADVKLAVSEFGMVDIGFNFPAIAMQQFNQGKPWDVVSNDGGIDGGHCVLVVGYDVNYLYVYTWGAVQKMTYAFWAKYVEEAWAVIDEDWVSMSKGLDPEGVDKYAFGAQWAALTKQPNPFPAPVPTPPPTPTPPPVPVPPPTPVPPPVPVGPDAAEKVLLAAAKKYRNSLTARKYMLEALTGWENDKGFTEGK